MLIIYIYLFIHFSNCRNDLRRIGAYKFKFSDDFSNIANIEVNGKNGGEKDIDVVIAKTPSHINEVEQKGGAEKKDDVSLLSLSKDSIQSIGYTSDTYPNPILNPQLCIHTLDNTGKSLICDPDGILTDAQQNSINKMLLSSSVRIFVGLAYSIFTHSNKDKELDEFLSELLRQWGGTKYKGLDDCLLLFYLKDGDVLKMKSGGDESIYRGKIEELGNLIGTGHKNIYEDLKLIISKFNKVNGYRIKGGATMGLVSCAVVILVWWVYKFL